VKLKTRLVISFCIIIILPIALMSGILFGYYQIYTHTAQKHYGEEGAQGLINAPFFGEGPYTQAQMQQLTAELIVLVVLVLAITAVCMTLWLYQSMMSPIKKLQKATQNIKEGNLDFTIESDSEDEIGELTRNFEEMRQRLKESTEERVRSEQENRVLISNIAHDLKTPITAVKGYAEGLVDGVADTPEKLNRYVQTIYNKANEMDRLINELTLYSNIDANRIPYNFDKINAKAYFDDCIEDIGMDLETQGIKLTYENNVEDDVQIIADPEQIMRVINNIISNGVKYMDKPYKLIGIRLRDVGDFVQIEIDDNGKGIALKDLPYIFDRFYRTDSSRNSKTGGSGIGLSIVKKIVEDHGGRIWATSKEGVGTTMYFVLRKYVDTVLQ
jgi:signal transduction histidine kinase